MVAIVKHVTALITVFTPAPDCFVPRISTLTFTATLGRETTSVVFKGFGASCAVRAPLHSPYPYPASNCYPSANPSYAAGGKQIILQASSYETVAACPAGFSLACPAKSPDLNPTAGPLPSDGQQAAGVCCQSGYTCAEDGLACATHITKGAIVTAVHIRADSTCNEVTTTFTAEKDLGSHQGASFILVQSAKDSSSHRKRDPAPDIVSGFTTTPTDSPADPTESIEGFPADIGPTGAADSSGSSGSSGSTSTDDSDNSDHTSRNVGLGISVAAGILLLLAGVGFRVKQWKLKQDKKDPRSKHYKGKKVIGADSNDDTSGNVLGKPELDAETCVRELEPNEVRVEPRELPVPISPRANAFELDGTSKPTELS